MRIGIDLGQTNEILAQVGALIKSPTGPLGLPVRKAVLAGSSMSAGVLVNYLPTHARYRTPDMQHIYDGFLPTSIGSTVDRADVPLIQLPTLREVESSVSRRNDGDEPGNPRGGIRTPYVDVPTATYKPTNVAADPLPAKVSAYVEANGPRGASQMCGLSNYQYPFSKDELKALYGSPDAYRKAFEQRLDELEAEGWSLPLYHGMIMADAEAIDF